MILKKEIIDIADKARTDVKYIDKDYVLGHYINEMFALDWFKDNLIFKGGTCLRKCYFYDYRFSEDLDFTSVNKGTVPNNINFNIINENLFSKYEIRLTDHNFKEKIFNDKVIGFETTLRYWGANHKKSDIIPALDRWIDRIKVEISVTENIYFKTTNKKMFHCFSDENSIKFNDIVCYTLEEILTEKLRCLMQRRYSAPRDYYDLWFLLNKTNFAFNYKEIKKALVKKASDKNIFDYTVDNIINKSDILTIKKHWNSTVKMLLLNDRNIDLEELINSLKINIMEILS